jgi:capsular polysaccharide transport system permease protein
MQNVQRRPHKTMTFKAAAIRKGNVMKAVMLRDMRTRFFDHGLGFLVVVLWPLAHLFLLLGIYSVIGRATPYGESMMLFFGTGLVPTLAFMYVSRQMVGSLLANKPMLSFPSIKVTDIIFGRAALETLGSFLMAAFVLMIFGLSGEPFIPVDIPNAVAALCASILVAIGVGFVVSLLAALIPAVALGYVLFVVVVYLTSGTLFVVSSMPAPVVEVLSWNPMLHGVEWMRTAYYLDYPDQVLDKGYMLAFGAITLFMGLIIERFSRPYVM